MRIIRTKSYKQAMKIAHHYLVSGREVSVGKHRGDKFWEIKIAARKK